MIDPIQSDLEFAVEDARGENWRSLAAPLGLAVVMYAAVLALSFLVLGQFDEMYSDFGLNLPAPTKWLLNLGDAVRTRPLATFLVFVFAAVSISLVCRLLVRAASRVPILGSFLKGRRADLLEAARVCEVAAQARRTHDAAHTALEEVLSSRHASPFFRGLNRLASGMQDSSNHSSLESISVNDLPANFSLAFSESVTQKNAVAMLRQASFSYRQRMADRASHDSGMAPGWVVLYVGALVMFVIVALFAPLVNLISGLA